MKKILSIAIAILLVSTMSISAFATYSFDTPTYDNLQPEGLADDITVPGWGYIGLDGAITPDPDPDEKPVVIPDPDMTYIDVSVPVQFLWAAFESNKSATPSNIVSPTYNLINNSDDVNLEVSLDSFTATGGDTLPVGSTLVLNLTGNLAKTNIVGGAASTYSSKLLAEATWTFGISGVYTGSYGAAAVQPKYAMVLGFAVDSVNGAE